MHQFHPAGCFCSACASARLRFYAHMSDSSVDDGCKPFKAASADDVKVLREEVAALKTIINAWNKVELNKAERPHTLTINGEVFNPVWEPKAGKMYYTVDDWLMEIFGAFECYPEYRKEYGNRLLFETLDESRRFCKAITASKP